MELIKIGKYIAGKRKEVGLFALVCGKESVCTSVIDEYGQTTAPANDYVCYFFVEFGK